jgi:hypothetical protein
MRRRRAARKTRARHAASNSIWSVSNTNRQCNPRLFGGGFVAVMLALEKNGTEVACIRQSHMIGHASNEVKVAGRPA